MSRSHPFLARLAGLLTGRRPEARPRHFRIANQTRNTLLAANAELAETAAQRSKGLLGRKSMAVGEALWIVPCESVHTFWMQFSLDLVYLDRHLRVVKIRTHVPPWRISICLRAHSVIELPAGAVVPGTLAPGDQLSFSTSDSTEAE